MVNSKGRILIVDDEPSLLLFTQKYLERLGYEVDAFSTAGAAWERFQAAPSTWPLAIVDLSLPDKPGEQLLMEMLAVQPTLRAIVCSGYAYDTSALNMGDQVRSLQKPFTPRVLGEAVAEQLAGI